MKEETREERILRWLRTTGLLPPEERGFVPRAEISPPTKEEMEQLKARLAAEEKARKEAEALKPAVQKKGEDDYQPRHPTWGVASITKGDAGPGWDNVVRAYEEDR
jgi:hypothetical protein